MAHYPGYTVLRTEDCPEQHGTLTLLTHDVSGAAVPHDQLAGKIHRQPLLLPGIVRDQTAQLRDILTRAAPVVEIGLA